MKHAILLGEEAQEAEKDYLEHEIHQETGLGEQKENLLEQSFNEAVLDEKGYNLQQAYRKIGGMGKLLNHSHTHSLLIIECFHS